MDSEKDIPGKVYNNDNKVNVLYSSLGFGNLTTRFLPAGVAALY